MPKKRSKNAEEYLKGLNRELSKENRHLKKRIRQLEKTEHMYEDAILNEADIEYEETKTSDICQSCGKGKLVYLDILDRIFSTCSVCGDRIKIK